jgi:Ca2+-binding EF-hand superfamily protein
MSNEGAPLPSGYTKCDLRAQGGRPQFRVSNERAWANPTPTPWGRDKIQLESNSRGASLPLAARMDSKSGVVGKFRSHYSTIEQVKTAFLQYDINRDGKISKQELEDGMVQSGQFSFDDARTAFDIADINGDGEIDIGEFVQLMFPNAAEIVSHLKSNFNSVENVESTFKSWDLNGDGAISFTELQSAVNKSGQKLSEEEMNAIFVIGDVDQNGEIDLQEFKRMMLPTSFDVVSKFRAVHKTTRDVQNAFKKFDANNDGSIDRSELTAALTSGGQNFTQQEIDALFTAADVNRDGTVDYEEFITLMCPSAASIVYKFRSQRWRLDRYCEVRHLGR